MLRATIVFAVFAASVSARADAKPEPMEVTVRVPDVDAARFASELSRRVSVSLRVVGADEPRGATARLEIGFDEERRSARVAYHDGESDAPALVVVARFAEGMTPSEAWLLGQAVTAIRSFDGCSPSVAGPVEVLDPWSPEPGGARRRWAEVLDPWLGCAGPRAAVPDWPDDSEDFILEGEVLDPWLEAAYDERSIALTAPRPGMPPREMTPQRRER